MMPMYSHLIHVFLFLYESSLLRNLEFLSEFLGHIESEFEGSYLRMFCSPLSLV